MSIIVHSLPALFKLFFYVKEIILAKKSQAVFSRSSGEHLIIIKVCIDIVEKLGQNYIALGNDIHIEKYFQ